MLRGGPRRVVVQSRLGREHTHGGAAARLFVLAALHRVDTRRAATTVARGADVGGQLRTQPLEGQELGVVVSAAEQRDGRTEASERDKSALK